MDRYKSKCPRYCIILFPSYCISFYFCIYPYGTPCITIIISFRNQYHTKYHKKAKQYSSSLTTSIVYCFFQTLYIMHNLTYFLFVRINNFQHWKKKMIIHCQENCAWINFSGSNTIRIASEHKFGFYSKNKNKRFYSSVFLHIMKKNIKIKCMKFLALPYCPKQNFKLCVRLFTFLKKYYSFIIFKENYFIFMFLSTLIWQKLKPKMSLVDFIIFWFLF